MGEGWGKGDEGWGKGDEGWGKGDEGWGWMQMSEAWDIYIIEY